MGIALGSIAALLAAGAVVLNLDGLGGMPAGRSLAPSAVAARSASARPSPVVTAGGETGSCVRLYSLANLADRSYAFDGTVISLHGNTVELAVNEWFRGVRSDSMILTLTPGSGGNASDDEGSPAMAVGKRYLVAGDGGFIWGCGFTRPYETTTADAWRSALGR